MFPLLHSLNFDMRWSPCVKNSTSCYFLFSCFFNNSHSFQGCEWNLCAPFLLFPIRVFYTDHFVVQVYDTGVSFHLQCKGFTCILTLIIILPCLESWHVICTILQDHQILHSTESLFLAVYLLLWLKLLWFADFRLLYCQYDL